MALTQDLKSERSGARAETFDGEGHQAARTFSALTEVEFMTRMIPLYEGNSVDVT